MYRHIKFFISGCYNADTEEQKQRYVETAKEVAWWLWDFGFTVICPHTNSGDFEKHCKTEDSEFLQGYMNLIPTYDAIYMLPNFKDSNGAPQELRKAREHQLLEFYTKEEVKRYDWENYLNPMTYLMNCFHRELRSVARVWAGDGKKKHGDFVKEPDFYATNFGKLDTHKGERLQKKMEDPDSGEPHMSHVVCRALKIMKVDNE